MQPRKGHPHSRYPRGAEAGGGCGTPDAPIQTHPLMWAIVDDLTPTLSWGYQNANCYPDSYIVHLRTGPFFQDDLGSPSNVASWVPANDLQPGSEYAWGVQAVDNGVTGPYAGERYFFTGPMCSADNMKAVSLLSPLNNWTVHDLNDLTLTWDYPDECLPEYYWVGLTTNLDFNGSPLSGSTGNPSTRWAPGDPLTDCTRYYWMVRPGIGDSLGPYSQVYTFRVEISGGCPPEVQSMIGGTVWEDQCVNPGPGIPNPLPLGCVYERGAVVDQRHLRPRRTRHPRADRQPQPGRLSFHHHPAGRARRPGRDLSLLHGHGRHVLSQHRFHLWAQQPQPAAGQLDLSARVQPARRWPARP